MELQTSVSIPILTISKETIAIITSFMKERSQLALAITCKTLHGYYERSAEIILCDSECEESRVHYCVKALKCLMSRNSWVYVKVLPIVASVDLQETDGYTIKGLYFSQELKIPNRLNCANLNVLMIASSSDSYRKELIPHDTFFANFSNLKSIVLQKFPFSSRMMPMFSKFTYLESIFLDVCDMRDCDISNMFTNCHTLQELRLVSIRFGSRAPLSLPKQLKIFEIEQPQQVPYGLFEIDASNCTQLESL